MERQSRYFDVAAIVTIILLGSFGLFLLLSVEPNLFFQQLVYFIAGCFILIFLSFIDSIVLWWIAPIGYILGNIFLVFSYLGPSIRGAHRWLIIGYSQLQPSELVKPIFLLAFSFFIIKYPARNFRNLPLHIFLFLIPFLLVFKQPDLGTSMIYLLMWLSMMVAGGLSVPLVAGCILTFLFGLPAFWQMLAPYQKLRIETFLNPAMDPQGAGYNALQAMIAVGSGQLFGRGLGFGTQSHLQFLPEYHTDFIFATLIEELGFAGGVVLLLAYAFLLWRLIAPYVHGVIDDSFSFVFAVGFFAMLLSQVAINSGMNMGIIPVTGITLPLVSYGGSSLLSIAASFGILWAIQASRRV